MMPRPPAASHISVCLRARRPRRRARLALWASHAWPRLHAAAVLPAVARPPGVLVLCAVVQRVDVLRPELRGLRPRPWLQTRLERARNQLRQLVQHVHVRGAPVLGLRQEPLRRRCLEGGAEVAALCAVSAAAPGGATCARPVSRRERLLGVWHLDLHECLELRRRPSHAAAHQGPLVVWHGGANLPSWRAVASAVAPAPAPAHVL